MKRWKVWLQADRGRCVALLVTLLACVCLLTGLLRSPRLYPIDYGQYETILPQAGLDYTKADTKTDTLQYVRAITEFRYTHFSWAKLFSPSSPPSLTYGVALVRLFTAPLGLGFSVDALAAVLAALILLAVYSLAYSGYRLIGNAVLLPGLLACSVFSDANFCALLRGLYPQGAAMVFTLLFLASVLRAFTSSKGAGLRCLLPLTVAGTLFLKAYSPLIVFLPVVLLAFFLALRQEYRSMTNRLLRTALCAAILLTGLVPATVACVQDPDLVSNAAVYHSVFGALLPTSPDAEKDLEEFGLDKTYAADIGHSYYEPDASYTHNPRSEKEAQTLFTAITPEKVFRFYLSHPQRLAAVLKNAPLKLNGYDNVRNIEAGETTSEKYYTTRTDGGLFAFFRLLLSGGYGVFGIICLLCAAGALLSGIFKRRPPAFLSALSVLCAAAYLPFCVVFCGYDGFSQFRLYQVFLQDILFFALVSAAIPAVCRASVWLTAFTDHPAKRRIPAAPPTVRTSIFRPFCVKGIKLIYNVTSCRRHIVIITAAAALFMTGFLQFHSPHAACVNNGDFGRMMNQLGITWTSENYFNSASQSNHQAIEQYAWSVPFDWRCLTPLKPVYSLYLFVSVIRLFSEPFGLPLNTWALSILMSGIAVGCILLIIRDLYAVLRRWSLAAGLGLCAAFCSETYLVWYNGLFGESCILIGLLMNVACAVHLALMPRRGKIRLLWFAGLLVSLQILLGAKSQMLIALPAALFVFLFLLWLHRPYRIDSSILLGAAGALMCVVLCFYAFGVYNADRDGQSATTKSNLWHTYFYGIFMISDDPIGDMEKLGVDTAMAPDIGKFVSFDKNTEYVYSPLSDEAQTAFYDHVSLSTAMEWYVTHPSKLWYMLEHAAQQAHQLYTGYRVYVGQDYSAAHDEVNGFGLWLYWRGVFAPTVFWGYMLFYAVFLITAVRRILRRTMPTEQRALWGVSLFIMAVGVLQYPLTVLGNGFADNQKQLFPFSLCHDFLVLTVLVLALRWLWRYGHAKRAQGSHQREYGKTGAEQESLIAAENSHSVKMTCAHVLHAGRDFLTSRFPNII